MRIEDLPVAFTDRLDNWARWSHAHSHGTVGSWLYKLCLRMAIEHGKTITDGYREVEPRKEIDTLDAEAIERAITAGALHPLDQRLIVAYWIEREDPRRTARRLDIPRLAWESLLCTAVLSFEGVVNDTH